MAFCSWCGSQISEGAAFCRGCGRPLTVRATTAPGLDDVPSWLGWVAIPTSLVVPFGIFIYSVWAYRRGRRDGAPREPSADPYPNFGWRVAGWLLTLFVPVLGLYAIVHVPTLSYKQGLRVGAKTGCPLTTFTTMPALSAASGIAIGAVVVPVLLATVLAGSAEETRVPRADNGIDLGASVGPTSSPLPTDAPLSQPRWDLTQVVRDGKIQIVLSDGTNALTIDEELVDFEGWEIETALDMNGDAVLDAVVTYYTGGAHCCYVYRLYASESDGIRLSDSVYLGNSPMEAIQDLNGDGIPEMRGLDDRLAYFPDLYFAASPFLPLVLCRSPQGGYHDCTPAFPELLRESSGEFEGRLRRAIDQGEGVEWERSAALGLFATYFRLGEAEEGWIRVEALCPRCSDWLEVNLPAFEERMRQ